MTRRYAEKATATSLWNRRATINPTSLSPFADYDGDFTDTATDFDWTDLTGNGHTLRQATGAAKPTVVTPSEIGGRGAIRFDGVDDYLAAIDAASNYTFMIDGTGLTVMTLVIPRTALVAGESIIDLYTSGANTAFRLLFGGTATTARVSVLNNAGGFTIDTNATTSFAVGTPVLLYFRYKESATTEYDFRKNNVTSDSGASATAPGTNAPPAALNVGRRANGTAFGEFDMARLTIFNRELSNAELIGVMNYYTGRYGKP